MMLLFHIILRLFDGYYFLNFYNFLFEYWINSIKFMKTVVTFAFSNRYSNQFSTQTGCYGTSQQVWITMVTGSKFGLPSFSSLFNSKFSPYSFLYTPFQGLMEPSFYWFRPTTKMLYMISRFFWINIFLQNHATSFYS